MKEDVPICPKQIFYSQKSAELQPPQHYSFQIASIVFLAAIAYILHGSSLAGSWRYDDSLHLSFVADYSPWQYFFVPKITSLQSGGKFFTPWNAFFYDINLWLFGLNPKGYYAHQLIVLWLSSVATFYFLRLWTGAGWALFGSLLFLSNAATVIIAQELMSGHYAAGLLFSIIALHSYVLSVREHSWRYAVIGSIFYLLALLCKEVYAPLLGILLFLPEGEIRNRMRFALPYGFAALIYIPWRFIVLNGGIGGYNTGFITNLSIGEIRQIIKAFFHLPQILLGGGAIPYAILLAVSMVYFYNRRDKLPIFIMGLFLTLAPLAPQWPGLGHIERFEILFWWSLAVYFVVLLSTWGNPRLLRGLLAVMILALSLQTWHREIYASGWSKEMNGYHDYKAIRDYHDAASRFILNSDSQQVFYDSFKVWYPASDMVGRLVEAEKKVYPKSPRRAFITSDPDLLNSLLLKKATIWGYDDQCRCMEDISPSVPALILDSHKQQFEKPLFLHAKHLQNTVFWEVGPYNDGIYEIVDINSNTSPVTSISVKGSDAFNVSKTLDFYLRYKSPDGWITRSPVFHYEPASDPVLTWSR